MADSSYRIRHLRLWKHRPRQHHTCLPHRFIQRCECSPVQDSNSTTSFLLLLHYDCLLLQDLRASLTLRKVIGDAYIGLTFVRNAFGTLGAMCLSPWIAKMGLYNMFVLSGGLSITVTLLTVPMMIWGRRCRQWTAERYTIMAARQFDSRMNSS